MCVVVLRLQVRTTTTSNVEVTGPYFPYSLLLFLYYVYIYKTLFTFKFYSLKRILSSTSSVVLCLLLLQILSLAFRRTPATLVLIGVYGVLRM